MCSVWTVADRRQGARERPCRHSVDRSHETWEPVPGPPLAEDRGAAGERATRMGGRETSASHAGSPPCSILPSSDPNGQSGTFSFKRGRMGFETDEPLSTDSQRPARGRGPPRGGRAGPYLPPGPGLPSHRARPARQSRASAGFAASAPCRGRGRLHDRGFHSGHVSAKTTIDAPGKREGPGRGPVSLRCLGQLQGCALRRGASQRSRLTAGKPPARPWALPSPARFEPRLLRSLAL